MPAKKISKSQSRKKFYTKLIAIILAASLLISSVIVLVSGSLNLFTSSEDPNYTADKLSLEELEAKLQEDPDNTELKLQLADTYFNQDPDKTVVLCQEILAKDPDNSSTQIYLATVYSSQNKNEEARDLLETVIANQPEQAEAYYVLGRILAFNLGEYSEAITCLEKYLELEPDGSYATNASSFLDYCKAQTTEQ